MTTRKQIENLHESSGSKTAAALAALLGYGSGGFSQLHMGCRTPGATHATATALFDFLDDNPSIVEAMVEAALDNGVDCDGEELSEAEVCESCNYEIEEDEESEEGLCPACVEANEDDPALLAKQDELSNPER